MLAQQTSMVRASRSSGPTTSVRMRPCPPRPTSEQTRTKPTRPTSEQTRTKATFGRHFLTSHPLPRVGCSTHSTSRYRSSLGRQSCATRRFPRISLRSLPVQDLDTHGLHTVWLEIVPSFDGRVFKKISPHDTPSHICLDASLAYSNRCVASAEMTARP